jgi:predicted dehydrogenase
MTDKTYGVLVHGAGWVSTQHLAAYVANPHTEVLAVSSRSVQSARRQASAAGIHDAAIYDDLTKALQHPGIEIVSICTPQHIHCQNVLAAAQAGKHMVIEKPVANSPDELVQMQAAVDEAGVKTVVSFVLRWNPLFRELKRRIASGSIGRPYYVEADYLSHNGSWWSGWEDARTAEQGVSAMLVGGCHAVDAVRWFAAPGEFQAARPVEVFAVRGGYRKGSTREYNPLTDSWSDDAPPMEYDGLEVALVTFDNGVIGKVSVNADCIMPYRFPFRIFGDQGTVLDHRIWSHEYSKQSDWIELSQVQPDSSDVSHHPFQGEIDHFIQCLQSDQASHCDLADAALTHEIIFAIQRCYATGKPCPVRPE